MYMTLLQRTLFDMKAQFISEKGVHILYHSRKNYFLDSMLYNRMSQLCLSPEINKSSQRHSGDKDITKYETAPV